jgi:FkbM family methyltransferase
MNPVDTLRSLEAAWPSTKINWEAVLSAQYRYACPTPRCVVDVGANLGAHVAQFVDMRCPRVVAFEPIPELAARLTAQYPNGPVTVHQVALADAPAEATYYIDREVLAESGLKGRVDRPDRIREELPVKVLTLDSFALADVDFIKIDAEGADLLVLGGAEVTIERYRPLVSVEYGWAGYHTYGMPKDAMLDWATRHSYGVRDLFGGEITLALYDACVDRYYWDYFLCPEENRDLATRLESNGEKLLNEIDTFVAS